MMNDNMFLNAVRDHPDLPIYTLSEVNDYLDETLTLTNKNTGNPHRNVTAVSLVAKNNTSKVYATLTRPQVNAFIDFLGDRNSFGAKYRSVMNHELWKAVYGVTENYNFPAYNSRTNQNMVKAETVVACRKCHALLPTRIITIDHQRPQTGGELLSISRVFRGLGLTAGGPRDQGKNHKSLLAKAAEVGGNSGVQSATAKSALVKTLNDAGTLYYSVIKYLGELDWLKERCMHHYLNLRPLCGPCNSSLGNKNIW